MAPSTGRLDRIIEELRRLHANADDIIDSHVNVVLCDLPSCTSFGETKFDFLKPAGRSIDYIAALKLVKDSIVRRR